MGAWQLFTTQETWIDDVLEKVLDEITKKDKEITRLTKERDEAIAAAYQAGYESAHLDYKDNTRND